MRLFRIFAFAVVLCVALQLNVGASGAYQDDAVQAQAVFSHDSVQLGSSVDAAVILDIPGGYHINSDKPADKFAIPTSVKLKAPAGVVISPLLFPRAESRTSSFSQTPLSVFEGKAAIRFSVLLPADFKERTLKLSAAVRYQACNDEICFPPETRNLELQIPVAQKDQQPARINHAIFAETASETFKTR
jgi:DsbC/DsbD-like thiol-disulfide interchange protein